MDIAEGLTYEKFTYNESTVHMLKADMVQRQVRPVLAEEAFPFLRVYPIKNAIEQGSFGSVGGGFNMTLWQGLGISDQPLHALVVDGEIWTTGIGGGGYGMLIGGRVRVRQNRIRIHLWRPDHTSIEISHINRGHDGKVVAFTPRGGTNEYPMENKHYALLGTPSAWEYEEGNMKRRMTVYTVSQFEPLMPSAATVVLEARWPMRLKVGDTVTWVQDLGGTNVKHVVSGATGIVKDGINNVPFLNLDPNAPHGPDNWYVRKNPRMMLGASKEGHTAYIVTVEGRIPGSVGLRLKEAATMMIQHGVWDAVNMDGGGSAFMWTKPKGLVAPGCYNTSHTIEGLRPDHYSMSVF